MKQIQYLLTIMFHHAKLSLLMMPCAPKIIHSLHYDKSTRF